MAAATKYGNVYKPATTETITGPVRIYGLFVDGGASGGSATLSIGGTNIFSVTLAANESKESACPIALDSETVTTTLTGTAVIYLYEV